MSREFVVDSGGGDRFSQWAFSGYYEGNTFNGRLYYTWLSRALRLYKDPGLHSKVASAPAVSATAVGSTITIGTAGSSGLSGSVYWKATGDGDVTATAKGQLSVAYAFSTDMIRLEKAVTTLLSIGGVAHFRNQLELAKSDLDKIIRARWGELLEKDPYTGRPDWRGLRDPRSDLADAQAYLALYWVYRHKCGAADLTDPLFSKAEDWRAWYDREVKSLTLQIDLEGDGIIDREPMRPIRFRRA